MKDGIMEQYQIRLSEHMRIENLLDKLSLRSWTMIQKDLKPEHLTIHTYQKLSQRIKESLECRVEDYELCGNSCQCNELTLFKPLSPGWDDIIEPNDRIYHLFLETTFDETMERIAGNLADALKAEIKLGKQKRIRVVLSTVIKCVLADHIFWNSLCRIRTRGNCQPSCCSLMV
jgi:hypothetical protein